MANGISEETVRRRPETIARIEMVHRNLLSLESIAPFFALRELCVLAQDIDTLKGVEGLPVLESLWLCECKLTRIESFIEKCPQLRRLYLYSNRISKIELTDLTGLSEVASLKSLWVAGNRIEHFNDHLAQLQKLEELNIAANLVGNFREVCALRSLQSLSSLWLQDDLYGSNPICELSNYQTYTLHHLKAPVLLFLWLNPQT
eukprot:m51a1_g4031 hypothetical protein (203) ;mRNA; r:652087-653110